MLTLHFVRHGETEASRDHRFCGLRDCPLSDRGRQQVDALSRHWSDNGDIRAVHTSPLSRCRVLAEAIAARREVPVHVDEGLREIDHGSWDGRPEDEVRATEPEAYQAYDDHPGIMAPHGGETGYQVAARALPVITRIMDTYDDGDVLLVSHKAVIRIVACALLGIDIDLYRARLSQPVASVTSFEVRPDGPLLRRLGDLSHLPAEMRTGGGA